MALNEREINPCKWPKALICRRVGTAHRASFSDIHDKGLTNAPEFELFFNSKFKTQNSKFKTQNSKLKTQNSKLKTQNSKLKTQNLLAN
jgi:hypothetical protein